MENKEIIIGEIENFFDVVNEDIEIDRLNLKQKAGNCRIYVAIDEGPVPHFHISSINTKWACCVRIYINMYFNHNIHYNDYLSSNQSIRLNNWLSSRNATDKNKTNWERICYIWALNGNPMYPKQIPIRPISQPNYSYIEKDESKAPSDINEYYNLSESTEYINEDTVLEIIDDN